MSPRTTPAQQHANVKDCKDQLEYSIKMSEQDDTMNSLVLGKECVPFLQEQQTTRILFIYLFIYCVLTPLSAIFQLYHGDQLEKTTDHGQATGKLYHLRL